MPNVRTSEYLLNNYNDVYEFCRSRNEPMFISDEGQEDMAIISRATYEKFCSRYELYNLIDEGLEAVENGDVRDLDDFMTDFWKEVKKDR